jgi:hypothetical protein
LTPGGAFFKRCGLSEVSSDARRARSAVDGSTLELELCGRARRCGSGSAISETIMPSLAANPESRFESLLGAAAVHVWAELPRDVQEKLFEHAVVIGHRGEADESLREQLAVFLHDRHKRTHQTLDGAAQGRSHGTP